MSELSPNAPLTRRIEAQLAEAGLQVTVESSDGSLILSGIVESEEAREAATDIAARVAPRARIDNQLDVETVLPTDVDDFVGDEASADLAESTDEVLAGGGEIEPDFTDQPVLRDPLGAAGPSSGEADDLVASGDEVYSPPSDPVVTSDASGRAEVLGGFGEEEEAVPVARSAEDNQPGDEALA